jgi:hypothetical protein
MRLSRAAVFAFGTGTLAIPAACGARTELLPLSAEGTGIVDSGYGFPVALYGASIMEVDNSDAGTNGRLPEGASDAGSAD